MGRTIVWTAMVAFLAVLFAGGAVAEEHKYVGVDGCKLCHNKELIGDQYAAWKKSPHAKAFETLKSDEAAKIAKERGLTMPAYEADACLKCHATAHGLEKSQMGRRPLKVSDGVQCESCHGPGNDYRKNKIMSDPKAAMAAGLWQPGKDEKICQKCHNAESPTSKTFDYVKYKAKIAHPIPKDVKGHYLEVKRQHRNGGN